MNPRGRKGAKWRYCESTRWHKMPEWQDCTGPDGFLRSSTPAVSSLLVLQQTLNAEDSKVESLAPCEDDIRRHTVANPQKASEEVSGNAILYTEEELQRNRLTLMKGLRLTERLRPDVNTVDKWSSSSDYSSSSDSSDRARPKRRSSGDHSAEKPKDADAASMEGTNDVLAKVQLGIEYSSVCADMQGPDMAERHASGMPDAEMQHDPMHQWHRKRCFNPSKNVAHRPRCRGRTRSLTCLSSRSATSVTSWSAKSGLASSASSSSLNRPRSASQRARSTNT